MKSRRLRSQGTYGTAAGLCGAVSLSSARADASLVMAAEAKRQAVEEGLELVRSANASGYAGVNPRRGVFLAQTFTGRGAKKRSVAPRDTHIRMASIPG